MLGAVHRVAIRARKIAPARPHHPLCIAFAIVLNLIVDFDRPQVGFIHVSLDPLQMQLQSMENEGAPLEEVPEVLVVDFVVVLDFLRFDEGAEEARAAIRAGLL